MSDINLDCDLERGAREDARALDFFRDFGDVVERHHEQPREQLREQREQPREQLREQREQLREQREEREEREQLREQREQLREQREQLEQRQQRERERAATGRELFDAVPVACCNVDRDGVIIDVNRAAARMFGATRAELVGKALARWIAPVSRRALATHLEEALASAAAEPETTSEMTSLALRLEGDAHDDGARTAELSLKARARGTPVPVVQIESAPIVDEQGVVRGCRCALTDISARKRNEDALRLAVRMREDFLAVVSHDLRNPVASLAIGVELLRRHAENNAGASAGAGAGAGAAAGASLAALKPCVESMGRATARMNRLLADLLDFSSMDAGHLSMECAQEDVERLILSALEISGPDAAAKHLTLSAHVDGPLEAWCDRERVIQALLNLIGNAIKFTSHGSIAVRARRCGEEVVVSVHDTGGGMSAHQLAHVFDPYWKAERSSKRGTGLGLSIVKGIVTVHGGRVWAESVVGRGSTFTFTLPSRPLAQLQASTKPAAPDEAKATANVRPLALADANEGERPTILIVDDEDDLRDTLADLLESEGFDVVGVDNGRRALEHLSEAAKMPQLILLDLVMPVMDGWEFLRQRSRQPRTASVPVVLVTAASSVANEASSSLGIAGCIAKPLSVQRLFELLQQVGAGVRARAPDAEI